MDFEQNARPPPEITVEGTASLEELIMKRIIEVFIIHADFYFFNDRHTPETAFIFLFTKGKL